MLAGKWWLYIECCLCSFVIFHGIETSVDKESYSLVISRGSNMCFNKTNQCIKREIHLLVMHGVFLTLSSLTWADPEGGGGGRMSGPNLEIKEFLAILVQIP